MSVFIIIISSFQFSISLCHIFWLFLTMNLIWCFALRNASFMSAMVIYWKNHNLYHQAGILRNMIFSSVIWPSYIFWFSCSYYSSASETHIPIYSFQCASCRLLHSQHPAQWWQGSCQEDTPIHSSLQKRRYHCDRTRITKVNSTDASNYWWICKNMCISYRAYGGKGLILWMDGEDFPCVNCCLWVCSAWSYYYLMWNAFVPGRVTQV